MTIANLMALAAFVGSWILVGIMRNVSIRARLLDVPNERSSHERPIPRGGGLAIVVSSVLASLPLYRAGLISGPFALSAFGGGALVSIVGLLDDRHSLPAAVRIAVHLVAAIWAVIWLGGMPPLPFGSKLLALGIVGGVIEVLGIVWTLNLFNFMDGIDGIAGAEAIFVGASGAFLSYLTGAGAPIAAVAIILSGACLGFLLWNWPPAKIFMGDAGSGYVGFLIAVLALASTKEDPSALYSWLILGGVFVCDATVTLVRRFIRGERVYQAHRSHAYQKLARRWGSHARATLAVTGVNCAWLLPCAIFATTHPPIAPLIVLVALAPVAALVFVAGAGTAEHHPS